MIAHATLTAGLPAGALAHDPDALLAAFETWAQTQGWSLYEHQREALVATLVGDNAIITTPTGSGKTLIATAACFATLAACGRAYYTAPIKALVSEKFFAFCDTFGPDLVGMVTGDASVNPDAPIVCCTAEILANVALREGRAADVDLVVADEFHFLADPDRGWAWQVAISELPQAQFMLMSATLGDVTALAEGLTETTGRPTAVIADAVRPVPLVYNYVRTPIHDTIARLVASGRAPVYVVHPSQAAAGEQAQALSSSPLVTPDGRAAIRAAIAGFRFAPGYGTTLRRLLEAGIGVHHAGLLPKYRRLVETLTQQGLLVAVCGTDTLGVGINVPIRTVLFTSLVKFDGRRERTLRAREFHQIAGRAGRPGFDTVGHVVAQAPDHEVENTKAASKAGGDPVKLKSMRKAKPPAGKLSYTQATFDKLVASVPETLHGRVRMTYALLLNLLRRDEDLGAALGHLVAAATADPEARATLTGRADEMLASLVQAGVIVERDVPTSGGRRFDLAPDLQDDFALNQPLSAFALAALELLDVESPTYALDVVSVIEATLEDPDPVLWAQQNQARAARLAELKADGVEYDERVRLLDEITWPRPLAELLEGALDIFSRAHPWIADEPLSPKSVVRDMVERAMTFGEFTAHYKVQRAEGLVLRYLSDAYRALRQTVPDAARTPDLDDIIDWLAEIVRTTDSSLLDEWEALTHPAGSAPGAAVAPPVRPVTGNDRAFGVLIRNAMFRRVLLAADDDVDGLATLEAEANDVWATWADSATDQWTGDDWDDALSAYWDEHDAIGVDADARGPGFLVIDRDARAPRWLVRQTLADPAGNHDWVISAEVDPEASDNALRLVLRVIDFGRLDGPQPARRNTRQAPAAPTAPTPISSTVSHTSPPDAGT